MTEDYTFGMIVENRTDNFEPIYDLVQDGFNITALYDMENKHVPINISEVRTNNKLNTEHKIDRDVDDGFSYEFYSTIIYTKNLIVLL